MTILSRGEVTQAIRHYTSQARIAELESALQEIAGTLEVTLKYHDSATVRQALSIAWSVLQE